MEHYKKMTPNAYESVARDMYNAIFENDSLGEFDLLVSAYFWQRPCKAMKAKGNVVFKRNEKDNWRMPVIVVEKNGDYQDFYYNEDEGVWKMLSEGDIQTWWEEEEVCFNPKVPKFLEDKYVAGPDKVLEDSGECIVIENY